MKRAYALVLTEGYDPEVLLYDASGPREYGDRNSWYKLWRAVDSLVRDGYYVGLSGVLGEGQVWYSLDPETMLKKQMYAIPKQLRQDNPGRYFERHPIIQFIVIDPNDLAHQVLVANARPYRWVDENGMIWS